MYCSCRDDEFCFAFLEEEIEFLKSDDDDRIMNMINETTATTYIACTTGNDANDKVLVETQKDEIAKQGIKAWEDEMNAPTRNNMLSLLLKDTSSKPTAVYLSWDDDKIRKLFHQRFHPNELLCDSNTNMWTTRPDKTKEDDPVQSLSDIVEYTLQKNSEEGSSTDSDHRSVVLLAWKLGQRLAQKDHPLHKRHHRNEEEEGKGKKDVNTDKNFESDDEDVNASILLAKSTAVYLR